MNAIWNTLRRCQQNLRFWTQLCRVSYFSIFRASEMYVSGNGRIPKGLTAFLVESYTDWCGEAIHFAEASLWVEYDMNSYYVYIGAFDAFVRFARDMRHFWVGWPQWQPRLFFGMHPNAEINFRTAECDKVFELLTMLAGRVSNRTCWNQKTWSISKSEISNAPTGFRLPN